MEVQRAKAEFFANLAGTPYEMYAEEIVAVAAAALGWGEDGETKLPQPFSGHEFCEVYSGHNKVWPEWANDVCPICKKPLRLNDELGMMGDTLYHWACLGAKA